jgi:hypothetical protein
MARPRRPDSVWVPIGLKVSEADAARLDQVLARPEFAGWTRAEWCREMAGRPCGTTWETVPYLILARLVSLRGPLPLPRYHLARLRRARLPGPRSLL